MKHSTTQMARFDPASVVAAAHNICFSDRAEVEADDVTVKSAHGATARCREGDDGDIRFERDSQWWERSSPGEVTGLLCHELAHLEVPGHSPDFWRLVVDNYARLSENARAFERATGEDINWAEVREFLVNDPTTREIDTTLETAYESRRWIANEIGYEGDLSPFSNCRIVSSRLDGEEYDRVQIASIAYDDPGPDALIDYLTQHPHPDLRRESDRYVVESLPEVEEVDGSLRAVDGHRLLALLHRSGHTKTTVKRTGVN